MTCTKEQLFGLFATIEKDEEKIDGLKEQIKVIKSGPSGIEAEFKQFAKDYETTKDSLKNAYKYYKERENQKGSDADNDDYFTMCVMIDEELDADKADEAD
jgi:septal ring factor EnvC (AmiA/AmiB activator)